VVDQVSVAFGRGRFQIPRFETHGGLLAADERRGIHTVAQLLGHKDLRMAARYQHLSPAFLADAVGKKVLKMGNNVTVESLRNWRLLTGWL
jgi:integrase